MRQIRFGIAGCGAIFDTHANALKETDGAVLAAVFDTDLAKAQAGAVRHGVGCFEDWNEFIDGIDALIVAVPSGLHAEVGLGAARKGKHVLSEKPIDVNLANAQSLVEGCKEAGVKLGVISQHRFAPDMLELHRAVQEGDFGRMVQADMTNKWWRTQAYYDSGDWRGTWELDGGGCLMNQGVHYVDMLQWVTGGVQSVQAVCRTTSHKIDVEDVAIVLVEYKNGAVGTIRASTSIYPQLAESLEIHGTAGSAVVEGDMIQMWHVDPEGAAEGMYGGGVNRQPAPKTKRIEKGSGSPEIPWGVLHAKQIQDFTRAVLDGREPLITGEMALEPLKVILAIYESSRRGGTRVEVG